MWSYIDVQRSSDVEFQQTILIMSAIKPAYKRRTLKLQNLNTFLTILQLNIISVLKK